jgi:hypothetical protein
MRNTLVYLERSPSSEITSLAFYLSQTPQKSAVQMMIVRRSVLANGGARELFWEVGKKEGQNGERGKIMKKWRKNMERSFTSFICSLQMTRVNCTFRSKVKIVFNGIHSLC